MRSCHIASLAALGALVLSMQAASAADSKRFSGVSKSIHDCVKRNGASEHGTVYDPKDGDKGIGETATMVGKVKVSFELNAADSSVVYVIISKPFIVSDTQIFDGIADAINACRKK
jgi:hypothetical protein